MNNLFTISYEGTKRILLLFLYIALLIFLSPITLGIFFAALFHPFLLFFYKKFKIPYFIIVFITTIAFFYGLYWFIKFIIDSFIIVLPPLQETISGEIFQHPVLKTIMESGLSAIDQVASVTINAVSYTHLTLPTMAVV